MYRYILAVLFIGVGLSANITKSRVDLEANFVLTQQQTLSYVDLPVALNEVKKSHKIVMIKATAKNCHYCKKMDRVVFKDPNIVKQLNEDFIAVEIDVDSEELPFGLKCSMTPTFFFIDEHEKVFKTIPGSWNVEDFAIILKEIKEARDASQK